MTTNIQQELLLYENEQLKLYVKRLIADMEKVRYFSASYNGNSKQKQRLDEIYKTANSAIFNKPTI